MTSARTSERPDRDAIRVLVADDEAGAVDVLRALVGSDPSLDFIGAVNDAEQAIKLALQELPDVVVLDVRMPGGGGLHAAREISERCAPTKIVAISASEDAETVNGMIGAGAHSYVTKGASADKILLTIHRAAEGRPPWRGPKPELTLVPQAPTHDEPAPSVARAIIDGAVTAEFGAIVDIDTGRIIGVDVRPRLETLPPRSYDAWRAEAQAVGVLTDLELAALREAQLALPELPEQIFLVLDVSPSTASEARFRGSIKKTIAPRIVLGVSPAVEGRGERINDVIFAEMLEGVRS